MAFLIILHFFLSFTEMLRISRNVHSHGIRGQIINFFMFALSGPVNRVVVCACCLCTLTRGSVNFVPAGKQGRQATNQSSCEFFPNHTTVTLCECVCVCVWMLCVMVVCLLHASLSPFDHKICAFEMHRDISTATECYCMAATPLVGIGKWTVSQIYTVHDWYALKDWRSLQLQYVEQCLRARYLCVVRRTISCT